MNSKTSDTKSGGGRANVLCKLSIIFLVALFSPWIGNAQSLSVKGTVLDSLTREPVSGAFIVDRETRTGVMTDYDGNFMISAENGSELEISFLGYRTRHIYARSSNLGVIFLAEDREQLDATVIVGYGSQKKSSSVASITQTDGETLLQAATGVTNITEALQGMLPGVITINQNSMPGDDTSTEIMIRGKGTWQSTAPLVLVDGIERDMSNLDMNEIDKITVLKDASATAVYGVKGANGVILITTKQGLNAKPKISFLANFGMKQITANLEWADPITTMEMYNEAARNDGLWDNVIAESVLEAWRQNIDNAGPYNQYFPLVDMWDEITKPLGFSQNYNVNVQGGTQVMTYFASLGYTRDGDIFETKKQENFDPRFYYERYNWRSNFNFNITRTTKLAIKLSGSLGTQNAPGFKISGDNLGISEFYTKIYTAPTFEFPLRFEDGSIGDSVDGKGNLKEAINASGQRTSKLLDSFTDISFDQDLGFLTKGLTFSAKLAYTLKVRTQTQIYYEGAKGAGIEKTPFIRYYRKYDLSNPIYNEDGSVDYPLLSQTRFPDDDTQIPVVLGDYDALRTTQQKLYYEVALNYARSFGQHNVTALALMNRNNNEISRNASKIDFPRHEESWVGRVTYNWAERYLMEINAAYNGSEKFAPGKRFGLFPSFSAGWRLSEEPWIRKFTSGWLDEFKIRYSYGIVGSDAGANRFNYIQLYESGKGMIFGSTSKTQATDMYWAGSAADPNATWERAVKQNLGFELALWSRFELNLDLFHESRSGILMDYKTIPLWTGVLNPVGNIGKTKNRGFELEIIWNDRIGKEFRYWLKGNITMNQNRIVFRDDPQFRADYMKDEGKPIGWISSHLVGGYYGSLDEIYNSPQPSLGVLPEHLVPGDISYIDFNADGVIDQMDKAPIQYVSYPMNTAGLTLGFSYRGFSFSAMFYGVFNQVKSLDVTLWDFTSGLLKAQQDVTGRWTPENAASGSVVKPSLHVNYTQHNQATSSEFVWRNANYLRLKNAEVSYNFSGKLLESMGVSRFQLYVNGNNLVTWTKLDKRMDPETKNTSMYPLVRRYNIGLRLTF